jgi:hypothetical protein
MVDLPKSVSDMELGLGMARRYLLHINQTVYPLRDFYNEVRAMRDVESVFYWISVLLDMREMDLEGILKRLVAETKLPDGEQINFDEVRSSLMSFTDLDGLHGRLLIIVRNNELLVPCIRQRIQSVDSSAEDQCWVALQ